MCDVPLFFCFFSPFSLPCRSVSLLFFSPLVGRSLKACVFTFCTCPCLEAVNFASIMAVLSELRVQPSLSNKYECTTCGKCFPTSTRFHKHARLHSESRTFVCVFPGCGKSFKRKPHLTRHVEQHRETRAYLCTFEGCGKSFVSQQRLTKHAQVHAGLRCHFCGERFRKQSKLDQHLRAHETAGVEGALTCPICKAAMESSKALDRHMKRHKEFCQKEFGLGGLCNHCRSLCVAHNASNAVQNYPSPMVLLYVTPVISPAAVLLAAN